MPPVRALCVNFGIFYERRKMELKENRPLLQSPELYDRTVPPARSSQNRTMLTETTCVRNLDVRRTDYTVRCWRTMSALSSLLLPCAITAPLAMMTYFSARRAAK